MADYYSILEKTISGLPSNTPEIRNAVYKKARSAIETQLRNMDPVPSEDAVNSQLKLLEEAIVLIDSEHGVGLSQDSITQDQMPPATVPLPSEPTLQEPIAEEPPAPAPVMPEQIETPSEQPVVSQTEAISEPASPQPITEAVPIAPAPSAEPTPAPAAINMPEEIAQRVDDVVETIPTASPSPVESVVAEANMADSVAGVEVNAMPDNTLAASDFEEEKTGGFFGKLIKLLIVLGVLGGGGYALWKNKDALPESVQNLMTKVTSIADNYTPDSPAKTFESLDVEKETRPEPVEEQAPEPEVVEVKPETPVVQEPEVVEPEVVEPEAVEPEVVEPEAVEPQVVEPVEPEQEVAQEQTPPANQDSTVIPIGEVAYLYEEGGAGSGATRTDAAVTWSTGRESIAAGLEAEPVILGEMDIPERGMSLDIKIKRNVDQDISASHLIEIGFKLPDGFSGKSVESIARFVMKETEESPGEPLVAVPVKAGEANFLIALDNLPQAVSVNTQLLRDASWIDIPLIYGTGKRALLTLEKGGTGERVFGQAFRDWQNR